ncbi:hypothetical protein H4O18_21065 [Arenibacter sp. BSSL-BM3]|uniref:Nuclear transport factor 2 family protein n=1 Tax=Arenibacter arenosicollis TaxID=2762274 RepID=A0ABR7QTI5_9FLAO|nr:hypothetical protein [Arenibacter arenosicollis]MBC8770499.1 hypothetical protein [Arenibacter arenosicollis]
MRNILAIIIVSLISLSCKNEIKNKEENLKINSKDEAEILNTINNVYNNIVVDSNKKPDYKTIKEQFIEHACLGFISKDSLTLKNPIDYFDNMESMLSENKVEYLKEWEIQGKTRLFGNIAQRTSLYGVHFNTTDSLAEKGIINFQLVKTKNEWKILSMIWESEKGDLLVPDNYFE